MCFTCLYVCTICMPVVCTSKKRLLDSLKLELQRLWAAVWMIGKPEYFAKEIEDQQVLLTPVISPGPGVLHKGRNGGFYIFLHMALTNSLIKPHTLLNLLRLICQAQLTYFSPLDILKHFNDLFLNHVYKHIGICMCKWVPCAETQCNLSYGWWWAVQYLWYKLNLDPLEEQQVLLLTCLSSSWMLTLTIGVI